MNGGGRNGGKYGFKIGSLVRNPQPKNNGTKKAVIIEHQDYRQPPHLPTPPTRTYAHRPKAKLKNTKTADNKGTLLTYLVELIESKFSLTQTLSHTLVTLIKTRNGYIFPLRTL